MRILVGLSPQLRPHARTALGSLRDRVILKLPSKPDLIAWLAPTDDTALEVLDTCCTPRAIHQAPDPELPTAHQALGHGLVASNRIRNNLLQWLALQRLEGLKRSLEAEQGVYDLVVWARPDLYFLNDLVWRLHSRVEGLWISPQDNWQGFNDRYCFGSSAAMSVRWGIYDYFTTEFQRHLPRLPHGFNAEIVLAALLHDRGIRPKRSDLIGCRIRDHDGEPFLMLPEAAGLASRPFHADQTMCDARAFEAIIDRLLALRQDRGNGIASDPRPRFVPLSACSDPGGP